MGAAERPDAGVCAVTRGTDLRRYARVLHQAHDATMAGARPPADVRGLVRRSWDRVRAHGLDPDPRPLADPAGPEIVETRRAASPLTGVMPELRASLTSIAEDADHIMVVTDAEGFVLWREGSPRVARQAENLGFMPGADWSEGNVGTNAIGTALVEAASVQLFSAEHFVRNQHPWTCTACPVHDPSTGELLGVVDLSGPALTVHPTTVALVRTAVRLAESGLWTRHESRLDALRAVAAPLLSGLRGPALVVDGHGWVAAATGTAVRERVGIPREGESILVHGIGSCTAEHVPGGWLLRPDSRADGAPRTHLRLDLATRPPQAVVTGSREWRHPLSRRHAQILALLVEAGPSGMDASALSRRLYGDGDHLVTVRAEVSRLRRTLGGLLSARPYRLAPGVRAEPLDVAARDVLPRTA